MAVAAAAPATRGEGAAAAGACRAIYRAADPALAEGGGRRAGGAPMGVKFGVYHTKHMRAASPSIADATA